MNRELLKKLIRPFTGQTYQQAFYEKLYLLSLVGMNYAIGGDLKFSGEYQTLKFIKGKLKKDIPLTLFDVGANEGDYTKAYLEIFHDCNYKIHSFEPSKATYSRLVNNIQNKNNIILHNFGLSDKKETVNLYSASKELSGNSSIYQREVPHAGLVLDKAESINLESLDEFCEANLIESIDVLKMDVEGHELSVLIGSKNMLKNQKIKFIQFEFGGSNLDSRTKFKDFYDLLSQDYILYRGLANGLRKIGAYNEIMHEIFTTINFVAQHKSIK